MQKAVEQGIEAAPGSRSSSRGPSAPGSPAVTIVTKLEKKVIGYKDLAAIPKDKAILEVERPDWMIYEPHFSISSLDRTELSRSRERSMSPLSISPPPSLGSSLRELRDMAEQSSDLVATHKASGSNVGPVHHFHRPDNGTNIYKKPPIYKHDVGASGQQAKHRGDLIIKSSKFPAAQPPDPNQPSKIETEYWPCPPSLASMEIEWRKRHRKGTDEEEEYDDGDLTEEARKRQERELSKIQSNLGKLILKEEMEKAVPFRRKTRSLPDRTHMHMGSSTNGSKSSTLPACSRSGLTRLQSAEFPTSVSDRAKPAEQVRLHYMHICIYEDLIFGLQQTYM
ncbi:hypothetical protein AGOR_G00011110 [Albula goreensis]|uniref:Putative adherens-junction anchoring domain-containing protein n=1 Tax=Albula goreensis TaxID=1534307 RepID=A0A8T3E9G6_9TELE|nr:hypothetical protein AGOR_G00011110 [Albula goreensis]